MTWFELVICGEPVRGKLAGEGETTGYLVQIIVHQKFATLMLTVGLLSLRRVSFTYSRDLVCLNHKTGKVNMNSDG